MEIPLNQIFGFSLLTPTTFKFASRLNFDTVYEIVYDRRRRLWKLLSAQIWNLFLYHPLSSPPQTIYSSVWHNTKFTRDRVFKLNFTIFLPSFSSAISRGKRENFHCQTVLETEIFEGMKREKNHFFFKQSKSHRSLRNLREFCIAKRHSPVCCRAFGISESPGDPADVLTLRTEEGEKAGTENFEIWSALPVLAKHLHIEFLIKFIMNFLKFSYGFFKIS